jgi:hypothetical protein
VRYADDIVLLAKEETILQRMIDKLIEVGRGYGMEINVVKTKTMRISRQPTPLQIKIDKKPAENVEEFNCLGSMITNDASVHEKLRTGLPWQQQQSTGRRLSSSEPSFFVRGVCILSSKELTNLLARSLVYMAPLDELRNLDGIKTIESRT